MIFRIFTPFVYALGLVLLNISGVKAQQDFNHYQGLISEGGIPEDFTDQAYDKILKDIADQKTDLKQSKERVFLKNIHYSINDLLHSGMVTYGDEVTMYVEDVASKLLRNDDKLRSELRFYTIKSNETNAFSTFQGIIFVTTGLISQLTSEAQLAYILSHEIVHYTENHLVETFNWKDKNRSTANRIQNLSSHTQQHEFDADKLALEMYHAAGYAPSEILSTFDVLLFCYLPFDEVFFDGNSMNSDLMTIPEGYFPKEKYPIKAIEDADDEKSSHPNIKRRKEAISEHIKAYSKWQDSLFHFSEKRFKYIRQIARFESVRTDIKDGEFDDALYSIYILEKEYPNSIYLQRLKAKCWLGIAQYRNSSLLRSKLPTKKNFEGEIATLHGFLRNLDKKQASVIALRIIQDIKTANPEDEMIEAIWKRMVKHLAETDDLDLITFSPQTYKQVLAAYNSKQDSISAIVVDTVQVDPDKKMSKYDKIRKKNSEKFLITDENQFDTSNFYLYAISDLLDDTIFKSTYDEFKTERRISQEKKTAYENLSSKEQKEHDEEWEENRMRLDQTSVIYIEPLVYHYNKKGIDRVKSERLATTFTDAVVNVSKEIDLNVVTISSSRMSSFGTDGFNERAILTAYLSEMTSHENIDVFPTDYMEINKIRELYGTDKVVFSMLEHSYHANISPSFFCVSLIFYPYFFVALPLKLMNGNQIELNVIALDLKEHNISGGKYYNYSEPVTKHTINARVYDLLTQIKSKPLSK